MSLTPPGVTLLQRAPSQHDGTEATLSTGSEEHLPSLPRSSLLEKGGAGATICLVCIDGFLQQCLEAVQGGTLWTETGTERARTQQLLIFLRQK